MLTTSYELASVADSHLSHATALGFRIRLTSESLDDLVTTIRATQELVPREYPWLVPVFVVVGDNPRRYPELSRVRTIDYPRGDEPLTVEPRPAPLLLYRQSEKLGLGDIYRVLMPWAASLHFNLVVSDCDQQFWPETVAEFAARKLRSASELGVGVYASPTRATRYFTQDDDRRAEEDLLNAARRLALIDRYGRDRLFADWAGDPLPDGQSSVFVLSADMVKAILSHPTYIRHLHAVGDRGELWSSDLIVQYAAMCLAHEHERDFVLMTEHLDPRNTGKARSTITDAILAKKWREIEMCFGIPLRTVVDSVLENPESFLQPDVLAALDHSRARIIAQITRICSTLRAEAARQRNQLQAERDGARNLTEFDKRADRPGDRSVLSDRYCDERFPETVAAFTNAQMEFMTSGLEEKSVVEVGGGNGRLTVHMLPVARDLTVYDVSSRMIERHRERLGPLSHAIQYVCASGQNLGKTQYDVAVCSLVFIHQVGHVEFATLADAVTRSADVIFIFENTKSCFQCSLHTRIRSEDDLLQAFQAFDVEKRETYQLDEDEILFLKLVRRDASAMPKSKQRCESFVA